MKSVHLVKKRVFLLLSLCVFFGTAVQADGKPFKNVIVFVGDGVGFSHMEAASLYRFGEPRGQAYWQWQPMAMSTHSVNNEDGYEPEKAWEDFKYFMRLPTDSAAAATAISTGEKTKNGMLGMSEDGEPLRHLIEDAEALGKATGVLSSVRIDHATPAGFCVHEASRNSREAIGKQLLESPLEVIIGPGHPFYDGDGKLVAGPDAGADAEADAGYQSVGGLQNWMALEAGTLATDADGDGEADPWTLVQSAEGFDALTQGETPQRVLGLVPVAGTLQQERSGDAMADAFAVPLTPGLPDLSTLVEGALNVLDNDEDGFFLMAEGGAIDWAAHDNQPGRLIEEQIAFDKAIEAAAAWVEANSSWEETALFTTSDHECGYLCGPGSDPEWAPLVNNGQGEMPGMEFKSKGHTNQLVPLFAKGDGTEGMQAHIRGEDTRRGPYVDNTDIAKLIRAVWGTEE